METNLTDAATSAAPPVRPRNIPYARIWTHQAAPLALSDIEVALTDRGFVPGLFRPGQHDRAAVRSRAGGGAP
jgi:hypothetical protein